MRHRVVSGVLFLAAVLAVAWLAAPPHPSVGQGPTYLVSLADVTVDTTATLLDARRLNRISLACVNTSGSIHVRMGDSAITTTRGTQIRATAGFTTDTTDAVYAIAESGSVTVTCTREQR